MATQEPNAAVTPRATSSETRVSPSKYSKRVLLKSLLGRTDGGLGLIGETVVIGGWVKSSKEIEVKKSQPAPAPEPVPQKVSGRKDVKCSEVLQARVPFLRSIMKAFRGGGREGKKESVESAAERVPVETIAVLQISDGSCVPNLQVVVDSSLAPPGQVMLSGTCILVEGLIQRPAAAGKHAIEVKAENVLHLGVVDHEKYPLSKTRLPLYSLRDWAHFRPRTTTVASIMRIRSALNQAAHTFFQDNIFLYVQVPTITTSDSEGFSKKFHITNLLVRTTDKEPTSGTRTDVTGGVSLEAIKTSIKEKSNLVEQLKRTDSNREALIAAMQDLKKTNELVSQLEAKEKKKSNKIVSSNGYFVSEAYLTVSGRLHLQSYACALGNVYSFGPRFIVETSHSAKNVAEMWMVEVEMAFAELEEAMSCATDLLKFLSNWVLEHCDEDMKFILKRVDRTVADRLRSLVSTEFEKIPYCQAVDALKQGQGRKFGSNIEWGVPFTDEHESYLADEIYKKPVIIYDFPKEVKPFYARQNDDKKTVAAFDVIVPKVGALIRGSQNEERVNLLSSRIKELGLQSEQYEWYLDLRRHGTVQHAGFSLQFDIMVLLATGITDVRDVIPFPTSYDRARH